MDLSMVFGYKIREVLDEVRLKIRTEVERLTALNISSISITVKSLQYAAGANANKEADG